MIDRFLGDAFGVYPASFGVLFGSVVLAATDTHLKLLDRVVSVARFITGACSSVTLLIVDMWQYHVCCIRSCTNRCTIFMALYLDRMCQCGLHAVLLPHIGILMRLLAAGPRSTARPLFHPQCPVERSC